MPPKYDAEYENRISNYRAKQRLLTAKNINFKAPLADFKKVCRAKLSKPGSVTFFWRKPYESWQSNPGFVMLGFEVRSELRRAENELKDFTFLDRDIKILRPSRHARPPTQSLAESPVAPPVAPPAPTPGAAPVSAPATAPAAVVAAVASVLVVAPETITPVVPTPDVAIPNIPLPVVADSDTPELVAANITPATATASTTDDPVNTVVGTASSNPMDLDWSGEEIDDDGHCSLDDSDTYSIDYKK